MCVCTYVFLIQAKLSRGQDTEIKKIKLAIRELGWIDWHYFNPNILSNSLARMRLFNLYENQMLELPTIYPHTRIDILLR